MKAQIISIINSAADDFDIKWRTFEQRQDAVAKYAAQIEALYNKPKVKKPNPYVIPEDDFHEDHELNKALQLFAQERKIKGNPMTLNAMKLNLDKLKEFSVEELTKSLYESIRNGHTGIFPKKERQSNTNIGAGSNLPQKMNYQGNV